MCAKREHRSTRSVCEPVGGSSPSPEAVSWDSSDVVEVAFLDDIATLADCRHLGYPCPPDLVRDLLRLNAARAVLTVTGSPPGI